MRAFCLISIAAISCAPALRPVAASMPSSMETGGYELVSEGEPARADGFFLTVEAARSTLKSQRLHELDLQEQIAERTLERDNAAKQLSRDELLARWGIPVTGVVGLIVGGILGVVAAHH